MVGRTQPVCAFPLFPPFESIRIFKINGGHPPPAPILGVHGIAEHAPLTIVKELRCPSSPRQSLQVCGPSCGKKERRGGGVEKMKTEIILGMRYRSAWGSEDSLLNQKNNIKKNNKSSTAHDTFKYSVSTFRIIQGLASRLALSLPALYFAVGSTKNHGSSPSNTTVPLEHP